LLPNISNKKEQRTPCNTSQLLFPPRKLAVDNVFHSNKTFCPPISLLISEIQISDSSNFSCIMASADVQDQLGQVLIDFSTNGAFPEEEVSAAYVKKPLLSPALAAVSAARADLEVCALPWSRLLPI
jgi:hypothetical protein